MSDGTEKVAGFVDDLLKRRRPRRFPVDEDDRQALQAAAALAAASPGADAPNPRFVEQLRQRLADAVDAPEPRSASRRKFLGHFGLPAAAAVFGAAAASGLRFAADHAAQPDADDGPELVPQLATATWMPVAPLASLTPGQPLRFTAGAIQGFLIRTSNHDSPAGGGDRVSAISAVCTHLGCLLNSNSTAGRLDCPCHGASFSLDGSPLSPEYTRALPRLRTRVVADMVEVYSV
jgi:nitrite reductase/ring-hydroxylating ferredoxin subunit